MKKLLSLLILTTSFLHAQHTIKGKMIPPQDNLWVALYQIKNAKPKFITYKPINKSVKKTNGTEQEIGAFEFNMDENTEVGAYRIIYGKDGYADFFFSNEDIEMTINPLEPEYIEYKKSFNNEIYTEYINDKDVIQQKIDSIQYKYIQQPNEELKELYKKDVTLLEAIQKDYEEKTKEYYISPFITSSKYDYPLLPFESADDYYQHTINTFLKNIDFNNDTLQNSLFLINKIYQYIFYINITEDTKQQQELYKKSIQTIMDKATSDKLKKIFSEYIIDAFTTKNNSQIVDWIIEQYYDKLPANLIDNEFKRKCLEALRVSIGRIAPNFSWKEDNKTMDLASLDDGEKYLLIFWSTQCSHCVKEIPKLYDYMKQFKDVSVVTFAIEDDLLDFNDWNRNKIYTWHNAVGTNPKGNKFDNKTVSEYMINETPTYFILDKNKRIIALPYLLKDIKNYFKNTEKNK